MKAAIPFPDISPEIFTLPIFGMEFSLRWYALAYIVGLLIGWWLIVQTVKRPALWRDSRAPMTPPQVEDLLTWVILGVIIGGRLGFVLFYQPAYFLQNPADIIRVWDGGMAFHGGFLGVIIVAWIFCIRQGIPKWQMGDALALAAPAGLLLGRIANFINAELWGRHTDAPWGVVFPHPIAQSCPGVEGICARHPSQLYEAVLEGLILGAVLLWLAYRRGALRVPGQIMGLFVAGYGVARFVVEFFRQADPQFITAENPFGHVVRLGELGVTMGQLLSLPMVLIGLGIVIYARRRVA